MTFACVGVALPCVGVTLPDAAGILLAVDGVVLPDAAGVVLPVAADGDAIFEAVGVTFTGA